MAYISVVFLYLPRYGAPINSVDAEFYKTLGNIIKPPKAILDDPTIWFDNGHINAKGSQLTSTWLANYLLMNSLITHE